MGPQGKSKSSIDPESQNINEILDILESQISNLRQTAITGDSITLQHIKYFIKAASETLKYAELPKEEWYNG